MTGGPDHETTHLGPKWIPERVSRAFSLEELGEIRLRIERLEEDVAEQRLIDPATTALVDRLARLVEEVRGAGPGTPGA